MTNTIEKVYQNGTEYVIKDTTYSAWTGIDITWTTISNDGVLSVNSNTWAVTVTEFSPSNTWTAWQVVTKTAWWYEYADAPVTSVNGSTWAVTISETVVSWDSGTTYTIKVANADPASWTPATTITFVQ